MPIQSCQQIPQQNCETVPRQECVPTQRQVCADVPTENCQQAPQQNCQQVRLDTYHIVCKYYIKLNYCHTQFIGLINFISKKSWKWKNSLYYNNVVGWVFSISSFCRNKISQANELSAEKIPTCANLALVHMYFARYFDCVYQEINNTEIRLPTYILPTS